MPRLPVVTLYVREGCHLCDQAKAMLDLLAPRMGFAIAVVDIESDEALLRRYLLEIPVVAVGVQELARAPVYPGTLEDALRGALGRG